MLRRNATVLPSRKQPTTRRRQCAPAGLVFPSPEALNGRDVTALAPNEDDRALRVKLRRGSELAYRVLRTQVLMYEMQHKLCHQLGAAAVGVFARDRPDMCSVDYGTLAWRWGERRWL